MWIALDITETQSFFIFINEISIEPRMEDTSVLIIVAVMLCYLSSSERKASKLRSKRDSNPDLCDAGAVINHLSRQAKLVIMWVYDKPIDI